MNLDMQTGHLILTNVVDAVKKGKTFSPGDVVFDIIENYPITFIKAQEGGRDVLRIILPDKTGCLDFNEIDPAFKDQWWTKKIREES
jgi:hypothetical protein